MEEFLKFFNNAFQNFEQSIRPWAFVLNVIVTTLISVVLAEFYVRYGTTVSNRRRFANNFVPLGLTTMLTIMIVKSSIALSLGLVGALSIVRFRAAIKDPEELTFLFLVIALGLASGANQPILALFAMSIILLILFLYKLFSNRNSFRSDDKIYINILTDKTDVVEIHAALSKIFPHIQLKRMDTVKIGLDLSFICKSQSIEQLQQAKTALLELSPNTTISIIEQPDLVV